MIYFVKFECVKLFLYSTININRTCLRLDSLYSADHSSFSWSGKILPCSYYHPNLEPKCIHGYQNKSNLVKVEYSDTDRCPSVIGPEVDWYG